MTARAVPILAAVTANERTVVEQAARHLADALAQAAGESWTCPCSFAPDLNGLAGEPAGKIVVTSLLLSLADIDRPWPEVEQALHGSYKALCEAGDPVLICTILRHVETAGEAAADVERAARIRRRLRQLNLLATELSRQYGALVIDIDRALADVGARRLATDYHLGGALAAAFASKTVALCIATNALDAFAPVKLQDAATAILAGDQPAGGLSTEQMMTDVTAVGLGRRRQRVSTQTSVVEGDHISWLVRQVLKRQIGPQAAFAKLAGAVRRRGARESAVLLVSGVSRALRPAQTDRR
jgi:hypothetical protein